MDKLQTLINILGESRNGVNSLTRHSMARRLRYSDGVQEIAEAIGTYWLLDIIATECASLYLAAHDRGDVGTAMIEIKAAKGKADLSMTFVDGQPAAWTKHIAFTDLPDHTWSLVLGADEENGGTVCNLILLSEY